MRKIICILVIVFLVLSLAGTAGLAYWLYADYVSPDEIAAEQKAEALEKELDEAHTNIEETTEYYTALVESMKAEAERRAIELEECRQDIETLKKKISVLLDNSVAADEYQAVLLEQIRQLEQEMAVQDSRLMELNELIGQYENITTLNFGYQAKKISDLLMKLAESNRPIRTIRNETVDEATGETTVTETQQPAQLAFYYQDLGTGYTLSYNSDDIMYSASLIKAPYIYSMLKTVADFEYQKRNFSADGSPLFDEEGNPLFEGPHPNLDENGNILYAEGEEKFDLNRIWTYDKETMSVEGSGVIRDYESGFQLTYRELAIYALKYSDNVAFAQLRKMFGYAEYYAIARDLGVRGSSYGFMQLSADDCGLFLEAIFNFIEENETYGALIRDAMLESNYPYLIPYNVSPVKAAHKYGWDHDSYHDMAIVYNDHPYILVIMTDLEDGGNNANSYIASVVKAINTIHKNFYAEK